MKLSKSFTLYRNILSAPVNVCNVT